VIVRCCCEGMDWTHKNPFSRAQLHYDESKREANKLTTSWHVEMLTAWRLHSDGTRI